MVCAISWCETYDLIKEVLARRPLRMHPLHTLHIGLVQSAASEIDIITLAATAHVAISANIVLSS